jgi:TRAP-type C4-dicarboxylate transport system permease small subunit
VQIFFSTENLMNATRIVAIVLVVAGILGLVYGGFSYTSQTHKLQIGSVQLSVAEKERVNIPLWAGLAAIAGGLLLLLTSRKS